MDKIKELVKKLAIMENDIQKVYDEYFTLFALLTPEEKEEILTLEDELLNNYE